MQNITKDAIDPYVSSFNRCVKQLSETTTFLFLDGAIDLCARELISLKKESEFIAACCKPYNMVTSFVNLTHIPIRSSAFSIFLRTITGQYSPQSLFEVIDILENTAPICTVPSTIEVYLIKALLISKMDNEALVIYSEISKLLTHSASQTLRNAMSQFFCMIYLRRAYNSESQKICLEAMVRLKPQKMCIKIPEEFLFRTAYSLAFFDLMREKFPKVTWEIELSEQDGQPITDKYVDTLLTNLPKITSLSVESSKLTSKSIVKCANYPYLEDLHLKGVHTISNEAALCISQHKRLDMLFLEGWKCLSDEGIQLLAKASYVKALCLVNCQSLSNSSLINLAKSRILLWNLEGAPLTDEVVSVLAKNQSLRHLYIQNQAQLSDSALSTLIDTPLNNLMLYGCHQLTLKTAQALINHPFLEGLNIGDCKISKPNELATSLKRPQLFF